MATSSPPFISRITGDLDPDWVQIWNQQKQTVDPSQLPAVIELTANGQTFTTRGDNEYFGTDDAQNSGVLLLCENRQSQTSLHDIVGAFFGDQYKASVLIRSLLDKAVDGRTGSRSSFIQVTPVASVFVMVDDLADTDGNAKKKKQIPQLRSSESVNTRQFINAIWCITRDLWHEQTIRLSYDLSGTPATRTSNDQPNDDAITLSSIRDWIMDWVATYISIPQGMLNTLDLPPMTVTLTTTTTFPVAYTLGQQSFMTIKLNFSFPVSNFTLHLDVTSNDHELLLIPTTTGKSIRQMVDDAFSKHDNLALDMLPNNDESHFFTSLFDSVHLWYIRLTRDTTLSAGQYLQWGIGLISIWKPRSDKPELEIVFSMSYDSQTTTFLGRLLFKSDLPTLAEMTLPTWDPRVSLSRIATLPDSTWSTLNAAGSLDLWQLLSLSPDNQPPLPHMITSAQVSFTKASAGVGGSEFHISADLVKGPNTGADTGGAPSGFSWDGAGLELLVRSAPKKSQQPKTYLMNFYTNMSLVSSQAIPSATLAVAMHVDTLSGPTNWILRASAQNLSVGLLHSFFENDTSTAAMAVMDKINLLSLDIIYMYEGKKSASFVITGVLVLGSLELDLSYQYVSTIVPTKSDPSAPTTATGLYLKENPQTSKPNRLPKDDKNHFTTVKTATQSAFIAEISVTSPNSTVAEIAESIVPGAGAKLPTWVGNIDINPTGKTGTVLPSVELEFKSSKSGAVSSSVLSVWVSIAGFNLTFIQYYNTDPIAGGTKRILRIGVDQIPKLQEIPLIGELPQPFDHLDYVWVEDTTANAPGITRKDLTNIAGLYPDNIPAFQVKDDKNPTADTDVLLATGHHFIVVVKGRVVLDHVFHTNAAETQPPPPKDSKSTTVTAPKPAASTTPSTEARPSKGNTDSSAGPLSVTALTLQYKNGSLFVTIDATLKLGPLTFSVIGFVIELHLNSVKLNNLANIIKDKLVDVGLHGLEVGVSKGPLTLEGVFIHEDTPEAETYSGGIAVGFKVWQILAVGQYRIQKPSSANPDGFRSVFVYGKLDGPLVELELATISGVRLGFGYNYGIRLPQVQDLYNFPFIADNVSDGSGNDPMKVLDKMVLNAPYYVYPKEGSVWFCAGMTIKAAEVVSITAVLMIDIDTGKSDPNDKGVIIALLGDGVFQMEPEAPPDFTLFYIELIISVELNFVAGYIAANAVLAPASHIYVPQARLTGGASFYSWFGNNSHAGEWVGTVGGFARSYVVPSYYPSPGRVGLDFIVGDMIHVTAQVYMAITPKCAMAGGMLHMSLSVGPVSAYLDLTFDAFINFKPFHFRVGISLAIGIECDIDILFIHIHVSISLGADLTIWGPNEFGGHAHVNFWFFGFDIDFGSSEKSNVTDPLTLPAFWEMVLSSGPASSPSTNDKISQESNGGKELTQHKYSVEDGLIPASTPAPDGKDFPSTGANTTYQVQAGTMKIRIDSVFAISSVNFTEPDETNSQRTVPTAITRIPDRADQTVPAVHAFPMHNTDTHPVSSLMTISIYNIDDISNPVLKSGFHGQLVLKSVPTAVWNGWDIDHDPLHTRNPGVLQNADGATKDLVMAVRILSPDPHLCASKIVDFNATAAMHEAVPGNFTTPTTTAQESRYSGQFFEPDIPDLTGDQVTDGKVIPQQKQRWQDFQSIWSEAASVNITASTATTTPIVPDPAPGSRNKWVSEQRHEMLDLISGTLEWDIPPPQLRKGADRASSASASASAPDLSSESRGSTTATTATSTTAAATSSTGIADVPYWQLTAAQPTALINDLDTYYPSLPYVLTAA